MDRESPEVLFSSNTNTVKSFADVMYDALRKDISDLKKEHIAEAAELKIKLLSCSPAWNFLRLK